MEELDNCNDLVAEYDAIAPHCPAARTAAHRQVTWQSFLARVPARAGSCIGRPGAAVTGSEPRHWPDDSGCTVGWSESAGLLASRTWATIVHTGSRLSGLSRLFRSLMRQWPGHLTVRLTALGGGCSESVLLLSGR